MSIKKFFCLFLFFIFSVTVFAADKLTSLSDINLISISSYMKDGTLSVVVFYKNRETDKLVYWKDDNIECYCSVYVMQKRKKGELIIDHDQLTNDSYQKIYIDIPDDAVSISKRAIVECKFDTRYDSFTASDDFLLK